MTGPGQDKSISETIATVCVWVTKIPIDASVPLTNSGYSLENVLNFEIPIAMIMPTIARNATITSGGVVHSMHDFKSPDTAIFPKAVQVCGGRKSHSVKVVSRPLHALTNSVGGG